ncbi:MAG TPA: UDP-N-acetylmuramoyl-tripeptide--D-alanyl-D-alanine ligase [Steroidobacteraceae bacterium]|nr:UDP-N-acetylmuramoyl-tripeptide--D-alanyl-D-alanine ligase [Steroidobacteraceae bacterium]
MKRVLSGFAAACGGELIGADAAFNAVLIDSRQCQRGDLFVALPGTRVDGHDYVAAAAAAGAAAAVVTHLVAGELPQIIVNDAAVALAQAAAAWRAQFSLPLVAVAGSNGKTTVKEMLAAILSRRGATLATRGNLNNHLGVPLTLFRLDGTQRSAVVEMGANQAGDVAALVQLGLPTVGVITNAGAEHLEGFGDLAGVARAEGEMVAGLVSDAVAVINADDRFAPLWRSMTRARVLGFGLAAEADFRATDLESDVGASGFRNRFQLHTPAGTRSVELALAGEHNVRNALAAAAAASAAGASLDEIVAGLASVRAVPGRLQFQRTAGGAWLIDDSYNANPSSVEAGIEVLASLPGRRWLVLGDMAELGAHAEQSHRDAGRFARQHGVERLDSYGALAALAAEEFGAGAHRHSDLDELARALQPQLAGDVRLLIKGSRVNRLERLVRALTSDAPAARGVA